MFDTNNKAVDDLEWTITVKHGEHKLTMHSIAALANFLLFPYMARIKSINDVELLPHRLSDATFGLLRALRSHTGASLKDLRDFAMGERRLPEPPIG